MEIDREAFRRAFPHLARELEEGTCRTYRILRPRRDPLRGFNPGVIDFIRRCRTPEEALEIIDYMERRGEISSEYAESLRKQLRDKGLRSFGPYKEPGYYFRIAGYNP